MSVLEAVSLAQDRDSLPEDQLQKIYGILRTAARENSWSGSFPKLGKVIECTLHHLQGEMRGRSIPFEPVFY